MHRSQVTGKLKFGISYVELKAKLSLMIGILQKQNKQKKHLTTYLACCEQRLLRGLSYLRALICLLLLHLLELHCVTVNEPSEGLCSSGREQVCVRSCTVCKSFDISVWPSFMGTSVAAAL